MLLYSQIQEIYKDPELLEHSIFGHKKGKFRHPDVAFLRRNVSHGPAAKNQPKRLKVYDQNVHPVLNQRGPKMIEFDEKSATGRGAQAVKYPSALEHLPQSGRLLPELQAANNQGFPAIEYASQYASPAGSKKKKALLSAQDQYLDTAVGKEATHRTELVAELKREGKMCLYEDSHDAGSEQGRNLQPTRSAGPKRL